MDARSEYLPELWQDLVQPQWLADTGIPLLATLGGLYLAYRFLKRQLQSDRDLRAADRRSEAARRLGIAIGERAREAMCLPYESPDYLEALPHLDLWDELGEAALYLPGEKDFLDKVGNLVRDMVWAWQAGYHAHLKLATTPPERWWHGEAMYLTFEPYVMALEAAGETLRAWNGQGHLPALDDSGIDHVPLPPGRLRNAYKAWMKARQKVYLERMDRRA